MDSTIFLPKTIKVGYQKRSDTYTGQLAYVIYYDQKGTLRKQASWDSWRDHKIDPEEFSNIPTSGFVLNKKVGDYVSDWNHRQAYVRVYDPRNFEFEITIANLLYILENANSIKGKGLEGEFVYGWDGTDLLLIPTGSPDYVNISKFSEMISKPESILGKDLVLGGTYRTNKNEDWIYLGRFNKYNDSSYNKNYRKSEGLHYYFYFEKSFKTIKSLNGKIVKVISTDPSSDYAEIMEKLEYQEIYSPIDESKNEYVSCAFEELKDGRYTSVYFKYNNEMYEFDLRKYSNGQYYITCDYWKGYGFTNQIKKILGVNDYFNEDKLNEIYNKFQFKKLHQYLKNGKLIK